jgi:eukaryotic-like serine/threonine-protein kinase
MQIDCPRCRRVLEYSGDRPSFCAYCGSPLSQTDRPVGTLTLATAAAKADTDLEETGAMPSPCLTETVEYQSSRPAAGEGGGDEFPDRIAGYRLVRRLGSGGMGTVFEAEDEAQAQRVAVKLIGRDHVSSWEAVERFRQEGKLASAVTHPRCVFVLAVDEYRGAPYIVMELMPGTTLQTLVDKGGPLDPASAIVKIFDVIEGLQQFHKRGLIHRDVKPSNCFLENEGRVKIGDFGLSKSLEGGADLTRTGTFIGTPLYASPEQIKRDLVDERTDVYSVAATLYYLLAGHPPVQAKDAAEALARIASEPAPPLHGYCPDIPGALEAVIHRGLERDPARRWRNLQEFHDALVPFVPDRLSIAGIGLRLGAYVADLGLAYLVTWAIFGLIMLYHQAQFMETLRFQERNREIIGWLERTLWLVYFILLEGIGGASLGKWLAGLRVNRVGRGGPPGLGRGLVRALVFYALTELPADFFHELLPPTRGPRMWLRFWVYERIVRGLGLVALTTTMRKKTGFRGPHEWLSGTRVVRVIRYRLPRPTHRLQELANSRVATGASTVPLEPLERVGPYVVRSAIRWEPGQRIVLGQDSTLERPVWIVLGEPLAQAPSLARRALNRQCRPRWIGGGDHKGGRWDAFTAPSGFPLAELVNAEGLPWGDVLPMIRQLAAELQAAWNDGTLPRQLTIEQIWIQPDGQVQLIDFLDETDETDYDTKSGSPGPVSTQPAGDRAGAGDGSSTAPADEYELLAFLGEVARLALEGRRHHHPSHRPAHALDARPDGRSQSREDQALRWLPAAWGRRIRAAVPESAGLILERLAGVRTPFVSLESLRAELDAAASRPTEISLMRRGIHLGIQAFFLLPGFLLMLLLSSTYLQTRLFPWDLAMVVAVPACWVLWASAACGGLSLPLAGIALVRNDGRSASRLACGWRAFLVWVAPTLLLASSRYVRETFPEATGLSLGLWFGAILLLLCYLVLALLFRNRGLQDRLAGTFLVPL